VQSVNVWQGGVSVAAQMDTAYFTTVNKLPDLLWTSVDKDQKLFPLNEVELLFDAPIQDYTTSGNNVLIGGSPLVTISFVHKDSIVFPEGYLLDTDTLISVSTWMEPGDTRMRGKILVPPDSLDYGRVYFINVNLGLITGDPSHNKKLPFLLEQGYLLTVIPVDSEGDDLQEDFILYPSAGKDFYEFGDTVRVFAANAGFGYQFVQWKTNDVAGLNGNTNRGLQWVARASDVVGQENRKFLRLTIKAEYQYTPTTSVYVESATNGSSKVVDLGKGTVLGSTGEYDIYKDELAMIAAIPDSGYQFSHWQSSSALLNGSTSQSVIVYDTLAMISSLRPVFKTASTPQTVTTFIEFDKGSVPVPLATLIDITPASMMVTGAPGSQAIVVISVNPLLPQYQFRYKVDHSRLTPGGNDVETYLAGKRVIRDTITLPTIDSLKIKYVIGDRYHLVNVAEHMVDPVNGSPDPSRPLTSDCYVAVTTPDGRGHVIKQRMNGYKVYHVNYGDTVRFTAMDDQKSRNVQWQKWWGEPYGSTEKSITYWFSSGGLSKDSIEVVAHYLEKFRIIKLEYCVNAAADEWREVYPDSGQFIMKENVERNFPSVCQSGFTPSFRIHFSAPIAASSIKHYDPWIQDPARYNFIIRETSPRIDYMEWNLPNHNLARAWYVPMDEALFGWSNYSLEQGDNVLAIHAAIPKSNDPSQCHAMLNMQYFDFRLEGGLNGLKSIHGAELAGPFTFTGRTKPPKVSWVLERVKVFDDNDNYLTRGCGDVKLTIHGITYEPNGMAALAVDSSWRPLSGEYSICDDEEIGVQSTLFSNRSVTHETNIDLGIIGIEDDDGNLANNISSFVGQAADKLLDSIPIFEALDIASIVTPVMNAILDGEDEVLGIVEYHASYHQWWGAHWRFINENRRKLNQDIEYEMTFRLEY
jgi:hypothetical protein